MNGWDRLDHCGKLEGYKCYQAFAPSQIPNLAALARRYVISDRSFADELVPTFGSHVFVLAAQLGGFSGAIPKQAKNQPKGPGWGCDSYHVTKWRASEADPYQTVPSCFPDTTGFGPFEPSPVGWVPTIFNRLDEGVVTWRIYFSKPGDGGYQYAGCTYFAECLYGSQSNNIRETMGVLDDARNGTLPEVAFVMPTGPVSQHNQQSMSEGDNYVGAIVNAISQGPDWASTAIFITYDDCGCFYDHVPPRNGWGIREPMVIVSPYARPGFTDHTDASFVSVLAFIEHNWGLPPLTDADGTAYDYSNSFDFTQPPVLSVPTMVSRRIPEWERRWIAEHPVDPDDPD
jgi:phospholipase C